jgi:hypothetical protein
MIAWLKTMFGGTNDPVSLAAEADHVELSDQHLVVGLHLGWQNNTDVAIPVRGLQVMAYLEGRKREPLCLFPLERFSRPADRRAILKSPLEPFDLPPHEVHIEDVRFISKDVLDLPAGTYPIDIQIADTNDVCYTSHAKIHVVSAIKHRHSEEWDQGGKGSQDSF